MRFIQAYLTVLVLFFTSFSYEDFVQYEKGYYYVIIKQGSFKAINGELKSQIMDHGWDIVHTINVDKTVRSKKPYKTHLLCKATYLKKGVKLFDPIGVIIPCKMAIKVEGSYVKIMVEDVSEYAKIYAPGDERFSKFLDKIKKEMIDILNKTASRFMKSKYTPYE
ncbi:DUF302 domain-containing protein [Persephonella sp.]